LWLKALIGESFNRRFELHHVQYGSHGSPGGEEGRQRRCELTEGEGADDHVEENRYYLTCKSKWVHVTEN
jgi:hypothetical protein